MQMGVTEIKKCIVVIFTNADSPVGVVTVDFDDKFWGVMKEKMPRRLYCTSIGECCIKMIMHKKFTVVSADEPVH